MSVRGPSVALGIPKAADGWRPVLIIHEPLEVPIVRAPVARDGEAYVVGVVDYLLTEVISLAPAVLEAERHWPSPEENVSITLRARESPFLQHEVLAFPARGFRTLLARLNHAYLADQLYGGCVQRVLVQGGRRNVVTMHTGNDSVSGLWLRVTSSVSLPEPGR